MSGIELDEGDDDSQSNETKILNGSSKSKKSEQRELALGSKGRKRGSSSKDRK